MTYRRRWADFRWLLPMSSLWVGCYDLRGNTPTMDATSREDGRFQEETECLLCETH